MDLYVQQFSEEPPGPWAAAREAEGWHGIGVTDHWYLEMQGRGLFHPFVVLGNLAAHTKTLRLTTSFGNNLARSPVEFAQAALTTHYVSDGRFEAGLGAGWCEAELLGAGLACPPPRERARRLKEALTVVRHLLQGSCTFHGEYYDIELAAAGPKATNPPRLTAALGGEWTLREISPLVDSVELATMGRATQHGDMDWAAYGATTMDDLRKMVDAAKTANPSATVGISMFVATGDGPVGKYLKRILAGGCFEGLAGEPEQVAHGVLTFGALGVDRITVLPSTPQTAAELAPHLFGPMNATPSPSPAATPAR